MSNQLTVSSPADLTKFLATGRGSIAAALPKHLSPDRMLRLAVTAWSTTPKLRECTPISIMGSIIVASQLGLEPGVAGQAFLIPYGKTCTLVPGWQGLVGLLNNTGRATAWTGAVFEGDTFEFEKGAHPKLRHIPGENDGDPDKMTHAYAIGKVNGSDEPVIECWRVERVWKHRDKFNKVGRAHYSFQHPEMYARKVVLLQVLKYMPRSIELNNALVAADAAEVGRGSRVEEGIVIETEAITIPEGTVGRANPHKAAETPKATQDPAPGSESPAGEKEAASKVTTPPADDLAALQTILKKKISTAGVTKGLVMEHLAESGFTEGQVEFDTLTVEQLNKIVADWDSILEAIRPGK